MYKYTGVQKVPKQQNNWKVSSDDLGFDLEYVLQGNLSKMRNHIFLSLTGKKLDRT